MPLPLNEHGRIDGCQSTNHSECNPETEYLFLCEGCGREFCWTEGAADQHPDLCDDCAFVSDYLERHPRFRPQKTEEQHK